MKDNHKKLLNSLIKTIDWDSLLKVQKSFNLGIGTGNFAVPGLKRKNPNSDITIRDLKNELRSLIKYMIENDVPQMQYSYWHIFWTNEEWEFNLDMGIIPPEEDEFDEMEEMEDELGEVDITIKARLEVLYCPQRIMLMDGTISEKNEDPIDIEKLENALSKAILTENYERAAEIRDLIRSIKEK